VASNWAARVRLDPHTRLAIRPGGKGVWCYLAVAGRMAVPSVLGSTRRAVLGPQEDYFAADQIAAFLDGSWTISPRSDRMAYQLEGPRLRHAKGFNIVSDGVAHGAIQVPGEGQPLVLMADRPPTAGYPRSPP